MAMATKTWSVLLGLIVLSISFLPRTETTSFNRYSFPDDFLFGTASSSYQFEGAIEEDGRTASIWDTFAHTFPERNNFSNGDVAVDFYHRYKSDIKLMKDLNMDVFRLSISWSRILPNGKLEGGINEKGVKFYKSLIKELLHNGIEVSATLFHWDLPQTLEDEYGGLLDSQFVDDFRDFARTCFKEFGDKVKYWTTFNEPWVISFIGYENGRKAPGRCSKWVNNACEAGDSSIEPYITSHNLLLAHAAAVQEFRQCYKCQKIGKIGIVLSPFWFEPHTNSLADKQAVKRSLDFMLGWHLDPITFGDYPESMKTYVGDRLPSFTEDQSKMLKSSYDYIGINYYGAIYAANVDNVDPNQISYSTDVHAQWKRDRNGTLIGEETGMDYILVYPEGIKYILNYTKDNYNDPTIYITENGYPEFDNGTLSLADAMNDAKKIDYHIDHLRNVLKAIRDYGVNVKGYFAWSLMDNFEWEFGYTVRFGLYYVDFKNNLKRHPRNSALWFKEFLNRNNHESPNSNAEL
ncbi:beta-glucosidase 32-like [Carica papaya]|uniref:beta-glucosidase 32-like n=1 Tax=Carica papaya TaxID=3649 RepID=UPI000B8CF2CE|nr:beta-glucosidase 32-like [Carica papaya]